MEKKKIALILGITALLIVGSVIAINIQKQGRGGHWFGEHKFVNVTALSLSKNATRPCFLENKFNNLEKLGLPENTTREEIRDTFWKKRLEDFGLTENSTIKEFSEAMRENMETKRAEHLTTIKEKLSLGEDASEEEIREALKNWREENRELFHGFGKREGLRGHGFRGHKYQTA